MIIRTRLSTDGYTIIPNHWLRNPELSWKAKGLLAYIASHREGYELRTEQIIREGRESRDAVMSGLAELEKFGYLRRRRLRNGLGHITNVIFELVENPDNSDIPLRPENPTVDLPPVASPASKEDQEGEHQKDGEPTTSSPREDGQDPLFPLAENPPQETAQAVTAGSLLRKWIDYCGRHGVTLTPTIIKRYGAKFKELLGAGLPPTLIGAALQQMRVNNVVSQVTLLDHYVIRAQAGPEMPAAQCRTQTTPAPLPVYPPAGQDQSCPRHGEPRATCTKCEQELLSEDRRTGARSAS